MSIFALRRIRFPKGTVRSLYHRRNPKHPDLFRFVPPWFRSATLLAHSHWGYSATFRLVWFTLDRTLPAPPLIIDPKACLLDNKTARDAGEPAPTLSEELERSEGG